jgi:uncharacterized protein
MAETSFDYGRMIAEALRDVARQALAYTAREGLPGEHHFYLSFRPRAAGVRAPAFLRDQYPDEMTVVLQNQFWDLEVDEEAFSVTLIFGGARQHLVVPFAALTGFADPAAQLGLRFEPPPEGGEGTDEEAAPATGPRLAAGAGTPGEDEAEAPEPRPPRPAGAGADVVPFDRFRKKDESR